MILDRKLLAAWWARIVFHPLLICFVARLLGVVRKTEAFDKEEVQNILVAREDGLGDMVLSLPLLRAIRECFPKAKVCVLTTSACVDLLTCSGLADEVLVLGVPEGGASKAHLRWFNWFKIRGEIQKLGAFDLAVFPRWDADPARSPALGLFSGARWRIGHTERSTSAKQSVNNGFDRLLTHVANEGAQHEVVLNGKVLEPLRLKPIMSPVCLQGTDQSRQKAHDWLQQRGLLEGGKKIIALGLGAKVANRRWPLDRYHEVLQILSEEEQVAAVILGTQSDKNDAQQLVKVAPGLFYDATCQGGIDWVLAIYSMCDFYLGNNTGTMHLAALAGIPAVYVSCHSLSGDPANGDSDLRFSPFGVAYSVARPISGRSGCEQGCTAHEAHCILEVIPEDVASLAKSALLGKFQNEATVKQKMR